MMDNVRVRFAPSPTGFAHIGNIRNAVFDWLMARHFGGKFILRVEDTDRARLVPGAMEEVFECLRWLGMEWNEGPEVGGPFGPYFQSDRLDVYNRYATQLIESGHAYYCFCTPTRLADMRKDHEAKKESTGYDRLCLGLDHDEVKHRIQNGECGVLRFKVPDEGVTTFHDAVRGDISFENRLLDDFVIMKTDGFPTYHFASVVDDHCMKISHVIRSEEWISSTPKHVLLYEALGWEPPVWVHPPLILGPDKSKLSKRHGAVRFLDYKERGFLPEAMLNFVALMGWSTGEEQEIYSAEELIRRFSLEGIVNHPVVFDIQKAEWMNGMYIRAADICRLTNLCLPYLQSAGLVSENPDAEEMEYAKQVVSLEQERMKVLSDIVDLAAFFFQKEPPFEEKGTAKWLKKEHVPALLKKLIEIIEGLPTFDQESLDAAVRSAGEAVGVSGGQVIHPIRMAATGKTVGPGLFETLVALGKERVLFRLNRTLEFISES
jgi:glutamyl-tRNA synthetase